jgi:hypothetical protein
MNPVSYRSQAIREIACLLCVEASISNEYHVRIAGLRGVDPKLPRKCTSLGERGTSGAEYHTPRFVAIQLSHTPLGYGEKIHSFITLLLFKHTIPHKAMGKVDRLFIIWRWSILQYTRCPRYRTQSGSNSLLQHRK